MMSHCGSCSANLPELIFSLSDPKPETRLSVIEARRFWQAVAFYKGREPTGDHRGPLLAGGSGFGLLELSDETGIARPNLDIDKFRFLNLFGNPVRLLGEHLRPETHAY